MFYRQQKPIQITVRFLNIINQVIDLIANRQANDENRGVQPTFCAEKKVKEKVESAADEKDTHRHHKPKSFIDHTFPTGGKVRYALSPIPGLLC